MSYKVLLPLFLNLIFFNEENETDGWISLKNKNRPMKKLYLSLSLRHYQEHHNIIIKQEINENMPYYAK